MLNHGILLGGLELFYIFPIIFGIYNHPNCYSRSLIFPRGRVETTNHGISWLPGAVPKSWFGGHVPILEYFETCRLGALKTVYVQ